MIQKTDVYLKRRAKVWEQGHADCSTTAEIFRRETWWLMGFIPLYSRETVIDKPR